MTIGFVHPHKAFLPEIEAYTRFFESCGIRCAVLKKDGLDKWRPAVEWWFMGMDRHPRRPGVIRIHEYASASLPPWRRLKDQVKTLVSYRPDYRLFLNAYVRDQFGFTDGVPYGLRDMGIAGEFFGTAGTQLPAADLTGNLPGTAVGAEKELENVFGTNQGWAVIPDSQEPEEGKAAEKRFFGTNQREAQVPGSSPVQTAKEVLGLLQYDFIYCGSVGKDVQLTPLLDLFRSGGALADCSILVLSRDYDALAARYQDTPSIFFRGPVPNTAVASLIRRARYAINYRPAVAPVMYQTSTKLLEYAACGVGIVTTRLPWVEWLQQQYGGNFFYLEPGLGNLDKAALEQFPFAFPDLSDWTWEKQIARSGVVDFLREKLPGIFQ
ncbi:MAG: hypothetical protein P0Y53_23275 [Candidatus Pseudobacter hemicellulosilyticus]|uniref:Spore protein YkvP/CgeB glycosyl transferase-like domain-containing protein n=1 Tax=Candidatus Pseudobacter hemicellulosilyticus TaxID=3121375 RepID=A0AAJ5WRH5_9BACT|nr:MAG: hypothetical protein P0Y53_23275 [Pseudobacter sp.]